ncbi:mpaC, partial [Symbiodinium microadriaticum]
MESFTGEMVHTELRRASLKEFPKSGLHLAAINYVIAKGDSEEGDLLSVTLCGTGSEEYLASDPAAMKLRPCHPWHHPEAPVPSELPSGSAGRIPFISAVSGVQLAELPKDHWQQWQRSPVKFAEALSLARNLSESKGVRATVLEMGAHPVMAAAIKATFSDGLSYACSMRRGERAAPLLASRQDQEDSKRSFFPGLAPHDLYRFSSIEDLLDWGADEMSETFTPPKTAKELHFEILGCALRFPGGVETPGAFWSMLLQDDQDAAFAAASKEGPQAAFLQPKFDHRTVLTAEGLKGLGVEGAEAAAMDPQHGFALQLAAEMWHDAGGAKEEALAQPERVGVYVGAWQPAISDPRASAYAVIGSSLSALAARVANAYNLQGPAVTVNTACSSALVAVHQAMQEARTGQLAYAVAGGVNLFGEDTQLFKNLRRAGMLSPTARCHTFSARADGYVRGEGGALFLLRSASGSGGSGLPSRAQLWGSAVTQNSTQKPLSSVDPLAQERVIRMACESASVTPASLAAVELHGTGTPLGDPVEVSALARVGCAAIMTASKMHVGHLESAAGAVGLVKVPQLPSANLLDCCSVKGLRCLNALFALQAVLLCENSLVPSFNIHGGLNPQVLAAMEGSCLKKPDCGPWVLGDERLQEMDAAMARLMTKGDEKVVVKEKAPPTGNIVPEGDVTDHTMGVGYPSSSRPYSALPSGTLEETVFHIEGFPADFPGIGKKSADLAKQLSKEEIVALFSKLKTDVERVLEVYQIYNRQLAQEKMLAAPVNKARAGIGHGSMGQLNPGSTGTMLMCPSCFADWQRPGNKVEGKCKLCQKNVIAVDKGPPSAEIRLGTASWYMFCGPQGVTWHTDADEAQKEAASVDIASWAQPPTQKELSFADQVPMALRLSLAHTVASQPFDEVQFAQKTAGDRPHLREEPSEETRAFHPQLVAAMEIKKKSAGPVDQRSGKLTEEECTNRLNPQLDVITHMQAGAHEVEDALGASVLLHLDAEKLRALLKRNYLQGRGHQGEEFFAAQTSLDKAKASNKRMQEEGESRARILKPVAESIDTWGPTLRAGLEMNVFNPETPLKDMELDDMEDLKDRYLNTKFLLGQGRSPFPASLLQELPCLAAQQREVERVAREEGRGMSSTGAFGPEEQTPEAVLGVPAGSVEFQITPPLKHTVGPFHAKDDDGTFHWRKEVQTWDLVSLFSSFGHSYTARHLYAVWSHLPITLGPRKRGAENKAANNQRRDDSRKRSSSTGPQVVLDLPVADIHDSKNHLRFRAVCDERITLPLKVFRDFPEIYNTLSTSLGQEAVVEVKMAWRCNTEQWWTARLKPEYAGPIYRKLGYSESYIQGLGLGNRDTSAAFGAERIILNPSAPEQELALPPITPENVSSVASHNYKRNTAGDKMAHVFWARMECGLVLSSVSPWEIVDKKKGETRGGYVCRHCRGFWRGGKGSSRFLMISGNTKAWVKDRIEFYKREPMAAPRDRSLRVNPNLSSRLRFSKTNLMGHVSDLIWSVVLSNPEKVLAIVEKALGQAQGGRSSVRRLGFTAIPWKESDVRVLLNTLRNREVSPDKLQQVWDTLKWFSKKFGLLAIDEIFRLTEKKKSLSETLVSTVPLSPLRIHLMDSFICGIVRFQLGTSHFYHGGAGSLADQDPLSGGGQEEAGSQILLLGQGMDYLIPTVGKDYDGFIARPASSERALNWLRAAVARQELQKDLWIDLTWHSFRVFMPDCALQAQIPRDQRQYLGNWMAESTADVYTREKRNVVCAIWNKVTSNLHTIDTDGSRTMRIDLSHDDPPDSQHGAMSREALDRPPLAGALDPDDASPQRAPKGSSPSSHADSPASSWVVTPIPADEVPPPLGPLTPVSATLVRGSKRKIHLLNQDLRAVGCG